MKTLRKTKLVIQLASSAGLPFLLLSCNKGEEEPIRADRADTRAEPVTASSRRTWDSAPRKPEALPREEFIEHFISEAAAHDFQVEKTAEILDGLLGRSRVDGDAVDLVQSAIRKIPGQYYKEKWDLLYDERYFSLSAIPLIRSVLRDSFAYDPDWAITKIKSSGDMKICDSGIQNYVGFHFGREDTQAFQRRLDQDFGDTDLFTLAADYWVSEFHPNIPDSEIPAVEQWLADPRFDESAKSNLRGTISRRLSR